MRLVAPLAVLAAAFAALVLTPGGRPDFGLDHREFARRCVAVALILWSFRRPARRAAGDAGRIGGAIWSGRR